MASHLHGLGRDDWPSMRCRPVVTSWASAPAHLTLLEPSCESGHRHMMRLLAITDRRTDALRQFQICREILAENWQSTLRRRPLRCMTGFRPASRLKRFFPGEMPSSQAGGRPDAGVQTPH
ncbi:MAG: hypothetical protein H6644_20905 [Caldilineaceae bacterium]|nr:hypothetical protein [Caldilineaceae bacterium]